MPKPAAFASEKNGFAYQNQLISYLDSGLWILDSEFKMIENLCGIINRFKQLKIK
jgi:hypothetical protein